MAADRTGVTAFGDQGHRFRGRGLNNLGKFFLIFPMNRKSDEENRIWIHSSNRKRSFLVVEIWVTLGDCNLPIDCFRSGHQEIGVPG